MYPRAPIPTELQRLAVEQADVVTREQALGLGLTGSIIGRLLTQQSWTPLAPGLYLTNGSHPSWTSLAWGGVLLGGDRAMLCRAAAGHLWGINPEAPVSIQVLIPDEVRVEDRGRWQFIRTRNLPTPYGGLARTPLPDTVLDLCGEDPDHIAKWIGAALHSRKTSVSALLKALARRKRQANRKLILAVLQDQQDGVHSELERIFRADVERAHGLPIGNRQVRGLQYRTDAEYLGGRVIIELDGRLGHEGMERFRDMARDNHHAVNRRVTLRYGWQDVVANPCQVARQIAKVLHDNGWTGLLNACPRCRRLHNAEASRA